MKNVKFFKNWARLKKRYYNTTVHFYVCLSHSNKLSQYTPTCNLWWLVNGFEKWNPSDSAHCSLCFLKAVDWCVVMALSVCLGEFCLFNGQTSNYDKHFSFPPQYDRIKAVAQNGGLLADVEEKQKLEVRMISHSKSRWNQDLFIYLSLTFICCCNFL